mmetsp:Transcript_17734/g.39091  ORF Transcript_17734/g.39091 Transcript_17734/m.39091 type:complete len:228 (+) Transcript_17734:740-1423(+)
MVVECLRQRGRIVNICQRNHADQHSSGAHIDNNENANGKHHTQRNGAIRVLGLLRQGGNRIKAEKCKIDNGRPLHHPRKSKRHERLVVAAGYLLCPAKNESRNDHQIYTRHHDVEGGRFLSPSCSDHSQQHHKHRRHWRQHEFNSERQQQRPLGEGGCSHWPSCYQKQSFSVIRPATGDTRTAENVAQAQEPTVRECRQFPQGGVGICVRRTGHLAQLGVGGHLRIT